MTEPPRAGRREWLGLVVLLLPTALMTADLGMLWLATPYFTADLQPSSSQLLWITDIYGFLTAGFLVIMGTLGDRVGRRRLLVIGSAGFAVASLLAAYASRDTLGGAMDAAERLPEPVGSAQLAAGREAFTTGSTRPHGSAPAWGSPSPSSS
nr:MFS transporter [Jiangella gansuensis]